MAGWALLRALARARGRGQTMKLTDYIRNSLAADVKAGFITSVVALPLAIAFALASGVDPGQGLTTAVIAGVVGSLLGGSRFSITGPTGAMTVIILGTLRDHGMAGLFAAGFLAGQIQILLGLFKIGRFVKFIPLPVVSGFTAGIGLIILIGQLGNGLGLSLAAHEFVGETVGDVVHHLNQAAPAAVAITLATAVMLVGLPKWLVRVPVVRYLPASVFPLVLSTAAVVGLGLALPQIGAIPKGLPELAAFSLSLDVFRAVLPAALTIALLGSIEALLCAVVADGMTGTRHDSDRELIAQGVANLALPWFGGIACTAAIARTAINIREGAKTRMAGVYHAVFLLSYMVFFGDLVALVPKAFLAGVLMVAAVRMINLREIRSIVRVSRQEGLVLLVTLSLTVLTDLVFAVQVGMVLAVFLLLGRLVGASEISALEEYGKEDSVAGQLQDRPELNRQVGIYTIHGPFFFGTMSLFERKINEHMHMARRVIVLRMRHVPFIDATGIARLEEFIRERKQKGLHVLMTALRPEVERRLDQSPEFGHLLPKAYRFPNMQAALDYAQANLLEGARNAQEQAS